MSDSEEDVPIETAVISAVEAPQKPVRDPVGSRPASPATASQPAKPSGNSSPNISVSDDGLIYEEASLETLDSKATQTGPRLRHIAGAQTNSDSANSNVRIS